MSPVRLTLLGKPGCHLCDVARDVVSTVLEDLDAAVVEFDERSILDDPQLQSRYRDEIPVVLIDGSVHSVWRVDASLLREAVLDAARVRP